MTRAFRTLAAAGAMALVLSACGVNQDPPEIQAPMTACERGARDLAEKVRGIPGVVLYEILTGRTMRLFLEALNASPPPTDFKAEQVVVLTHPEKTHHFVILVSSGCVVTAGEVEKGAYEKMKRGASI